MIGLADALSIFRAAGRHRRTSRDEIMAWRDAWLRRLIAHAYDRVPYYRALFDRHGVEPRSIRTAADLARIPVSSKRDIRAAGVIPFCAARCSSWSSMALYSTETTRVTHASGEEDLTSPVAGSQKSAGSTEQY